MSTKKPPHEPKNPADEVRPDPIDATAEKTEDAKTDKKTEKANLKASEELQKVQEALASEKDRYLRLLAEYDNFRKRSQKERETVYCDVRADTVMRFIPVYDNLERALKHETTDEAYRRGVEMIFTQLKEVFEKLGVTEIEAHEGTQFNPEVHDAVMHVEDESFAESVVAEELQKGFKLGDKVIRCSVVKVAN